MLKNFNAECLKTIIKFNSSFVVYLFVYELVKWSNKQHYQPIFSNKRPKNQTRPKSVRKLKNYISLQFQTLKYRIDCEQRPNKHWQHEQIRRTNSHTRHTHHQFHRHRIGAYRNIQRLRVRELNGTTRAKGERHGDWGKNHSAAVSSRQNCHLWVDYCYYYWWRLGCGYDGGGGGGWIWWGEVKKGEREWEERERGEWDGGGRGGGGGGLRGWWGGGWTWLSCPLRHPHTAEYGRVKGGRGGDR